MRIKSVRTIRLLSKILLGLGAVFLCIVGYAYLRVRPTDVKFTDVTSSSVTISWVTNNKSDGTAMVVGPNFVLPISVRGMGQNLSYDSRDVKVAELEAAQKTSENLEEREGFGVKFEDFVRDLGIIKSNKYYVHHVTIPNLNPDTEYKVMVGDGVVFVNTKFSSDSPAVKTLSVPNEISAPVPAYGTVKNAENEDKPIDELLAVSDGVVYFNYLDEATGERSNVFSSALNEEGNWYVDLSTAVDKEGNRFIEKYGSTLTNILGEVVVEAGPLGTWKKTINALVSAPAEVIVLNIPGVSSDQSNPESLVRIDSYIPLFNEAVQSVQAMDADCKWITYCGCGKSVNGKWENCACDEDTLERRGCNGQQTAQEAVNDLSKAPGAVCTKDSYALYGGNCKKCSLNNSETMYMWVDLTDDSPCSGMVDGTIKTANSEGDEGSGDRNDGGVSVVMSCKESGTLCKASGGLIGVCSIASGSKSTLSCVTDLNSCTKANASCRSSNSSKMGICRYNSGTKPVLFCDTNIYNATGSECIRVGDICNEGKGKCTLNSSGNFVCNTVTKQEPASDENQTGTSRDTEQYGEACEVGNLCIPTIYYPKNECQNSEGEILRCRGFRYSTEANLNAAEKAPVLEKGQRCDNEGGMCICSTSIDSNEVVPEENYCLEISKNSCIKEDSDGKICSTDGKRCRDGECVVSSYGSDTRGEVVKGIGKVIAAEEVSSNRYILDPKTGLVAGLEEGLYVFEYEGETFAFVIDSEDLSKNSGNVSIFLDLNRNGTYEQSIDKKVSDLASTINIVALQQRYNFTLKQGFNFVSFPFLISSSETRTAASLLKTLNELYDDPLYSIAKFDGSWKVVGQNSLLYDNNDFQLIPGQGYVIKASRDIEISIIGQPVQFESSSDSAPILFNVGWNLVGLYGTNTKSYTAESLIDGINKYGEVELTADNVTKWDNTVQKYEGLQKNVENGVPMVYGFDFPIELQKSYFVKISSGTGNWEPEIGQ